jgi:hypothetical protein
VLAALSLAALAAPGPDHPPEVRFEPLVDVRGRAMYSYTEGLSRGFRTDASAVDRARMGLSLRRELVGARVAAQQYRAWRARPGAPGEYEIVPPRIELHEAFAHVSGRLPGGIESSLSVGRQLITLHRGQLISERDFDFRGLPLDAARVQLVLDTVHLDVFNYREFGETGISDPGTTVVVAGAGEDRPVTAWLIDGVLVAETPRDGGARATLGPIAWVETGWLVLGGETYVQAVLPDFDSDEPEEVAALLSLWGSARLGRDRSVEIGLGYEELTGNLIDGPPGGFRRPAGSRYLFNGHMNLFVTPEDTAFGGLRDASVSVVFDPRPRIQGDVDLHAFWLADDGRPLGTELDITLRYWFSAIAAVEGALLSYASGAATDEIADLGQGLTTGYLQLRVGIDAR